MSVLRIESDIKNSSRFMPVALLMVAAAMVSLLYPIYEAGAQSSATVAIPKGAADPSFDPQVKDRPEEWYSPTKIVVNANTTVTWINEDSEKHSVTSGESSGRTGFVQGDLGDPSGIFDSGLFGNGEKWSRTFMVPGTYQYFCTIHPWMFGIVVVEGEFPDYASDAEGNKLTLPVMTLSSDRKYHVGAYWSPLVLRTGEQVTFTNDFFDQSGFNKLHLLKYDFVIIQNGKEIHRSSGFSERGSDAKFFAFSDPGQVTIRFENIGDDSASSAEFISTMVYPGESTVSPNAIISSNKMDPIIIQVGMYGIISGVVGGSAAAAIWYKKHWR